MKIKLVLSGSGTKFPVFAGALKRLEQEGCIVEQVIGTSGGSIIAAGIASGYSANEIIKLCKDIMPTLSKKIDFSLLRLLTHWGFIDGNKLKKELSKHFVKTLGEAKIPLFITATNFDTEQLEIFSSQSHPKLETASAVKSSFSIPVVITPEIIDNNMYVDGGVRANFAIDFFGDTPDVVGLYFISDHNCQPRPSGLQAVAQFIGRIINILISAKTEDDIEDAIHTNHIPLRSKINGLDFSFTPIEVDQMIKEGYDGVDHWIKANPQKLKK